MKKKCADFEVVIDKSNRNEDIPTMLVNQIIKHVADGRLQPGDKLPSELEMTRRFKISRISLREAMKLLEAKGYIESFGKQGKFICSAADSSVRLPIIEMIKNNSENIKNLFELKRMIFAESAYIAAQRAGDENVKEMRSLLEKVRENSCKNNSDNPEYFRLMALISHSTGNMVFSHVAASIVDIIQTLSDSSDTLLMKSDMKKLMDTLEEVIKAISSKDADTARKNMSLHIEEIEKMVS